MSSHITVISMLSSTCNGSTEYDYDACSTVALESTAECMIITTNTIITHMH